MPWSLPEGKEYKFKYIRSWPRNGRMRLYNFIAAELWFPIGDRFFDSGRRRVAEKFAVFLFSVYSVWWPRKCATTANIFTKIYADTIVFYRVMALLLIKRCVTLWVWSLTFDSVDSSIKYDLCSPTTKTANPNTNFQLPMYTLQHVFQGYIFFT